MPSETPKQARTMAGAAHDPAFAEKVGIPQKVAKEFNQADKGTPMLSKAMKHNNAAPAYARGGSVIGSVSKFHKSSNEAPPMKDRKFLKEQSPYNSDEDRNSSWPMGNEDQRQDYEGGKPKGTCKSLKPIMPRS